MWGGPALVFWIRAAPDKRNFWIERLYHALVASESKSVLWCTCFWVDGLGVCGVRIVPAAARGWFFRTGSGLVAWGSFLWKVFELLLSGSRWIGLTDRKSWL